MCGITVYEPNREEWDNTSAGGEHDVRHLQARKDRARHDPSSGGRPSSLSAACRPKSVITAARRT